MIVLERVTKYVGRGPARTLVLSDISAVFPPRRSVALVGPRGSGKTTLVRLLCGIEAPSSGRIARSGSVSFPVGSTSGFDKRMTVRQNLVFVARVSGLNPKDFCAAVVRMARLERDIDRPYVTLSKDRRLRLRFAMSYAVPFDTYVTDGPPVAGKGDFKSECAAFFQARRAQSGFIIATRSNRVAQQYCDMAALLRDGRLEFYDDVQQALALVGQFEDDDAPADSDDDADEEDEVLAV